MRVVHNIYSVGPGSFGLGPVALNLAREQNHFGIQADIWCVDSEQDRQWAAESSRLAVDRIRRFDIFGPRMLNFSPAMERHAVREAESISVVHQHALWTGVSRVTKYLRQRKGIPSIITPHGMLEKWALQKSWWKKRLVLAAYENRNFNGADCFHAVGENEVRDIRDFGLSNPVAVIPNGVSFDWLTSQGDGKSFRTRFGIPSDQRVLLFLSRVTPKKGLPMLLEAVNDIRQSFADWHLVIAGADEFGHRAEVEQKAADLGLSQSVTLIGAVFGQLKRDAFAAADLFVLPSYSEGAPLVILEALATQLPVIATKASPWGRLETERCGWWTEISRESLAAALEDALKRSSDQLLEMGQRGRMLVEEKFTWASSARMTIELYNWLLKRGDRPDFVVMD